MPRANGAGRRSVSAICVVLIMGGIYTCRLVNGKGNFAQAGLGRESWPVPRGCRT
ncbi:hypothetical protein BXY66_0448 [Shimia isoporae]|uniref:Uncharacterized protein n=1 Tax=Shimia isoporae TaxID=647720 RepID=A0A4R1NL50_9RHOB|nr:hypothetical protein BXY66_0448 [Shimia isoporae]